MASFDDFNSDIGLAPVDNTTDYALPDDSPTEFDAEALTEELAPFVKSTESAGNPNAVSNKGAKGLMQLMDATGQEMFNKYRAELQAAGIKADAYDPYDPDQNEFLGKAYLREQLEKYRDPELALAAYNAGPTAIDNYLKRTKSGTFKEVSSLMGEGYKETRDYVPKIMGNYSQAKGEPYGRPGFDTPTQRAEPPPSQFPEKSVQQFAESLMFEESQPDFKGLTPVQQIERLNDVYNSKQWDREAFNLLKKASTSIWSTAAPEDQIDLPSFIGVPPVTPSNEDPIRATQDWEAETRAKLYQSGFSPAMFGDQLDEYFKAASAEEIEGHKYRNKSTLGWVMSDVGNIVRETAKSPLDVVAAPIAGAVRLAGAPLGLGQETADYISKAPDIWLGTPSDRFTYARDENDNLIKNPDGTFQTRWQADAAGIFRGVGNVIASIAPVGAAYTLGASMRAINVANMSALSLGLSNDTFKQVYDSTGDIYKAYGASALTLPAAAVGNLGTLGIISGRFNPALKFLSRYDQARFIGQVFARFARDAAIGGVSGAAMIAAQQAGEEVVSGEGFAPEEIKQAAIVGAIGGGIAGAGFSYLTTVGSMKKGKANADTVEPELRAFRNDIRNERGVVFKPEDVSSDTLNLFGFNIDPGVGDGAVLTKKTTVEFDGQADIDTLMGYIESKKTPAEIEVQRKRMEELSAIKEMTPDEQKEFVGLVSQMTEYNKPEYQNNIKTAEMWVNRYLQDNPGALPVRWYIEENAWVHQETGKKSPFLKEALGRADDAAMYDNDWSDVSKIKVTDEVEAKVTVSRAKGSLDKINEQITKVEQELENVKVYKAEDPSKEARTKTKELNKQIDELDAEILRWKNEKKIEPDDAEAQVIQDLIDDYMIERNELDAQRKLLKDQVGNEKVIEKEFRTQEKVAQHRQRLENRLADLTRRRAVVSDRIKTETQDVLQPGEAARLFTGPKGKRIRLRADLTPEHAAEATAHEYAHSIANERKFPKEVNEAVDKTIESYKRVAKSMLASEMADEVWLPVNREVAHIPENYTIDQLQGPSKSYLFNKGEFLANQIAAIMAKRAGRPLKGFKIIPALEKFFERIKLPAYPVERKVNAFEQAAQRTKQVFEQQDMFEKPSAKSPEEPPKTPEEPPKPPDDEPPPSSPGGRPPPSEPPPPPPPPGGKGPGGPGDSGGGRPPPKGPEGPEVGFKPKGNKKTAYSEYMTDKVEGLDPVFVDEVSVAATEENVYRWIERHGVEHAFDFLKSDKGDPRARVVLADQLVDFTGDDLARDPTPENQRRFNKAYEIRGPELTIHAQAMRLAQRFRQVESFGDFMREVNRAYQDADLPPPDFSQAMLTELKAAYDQTASLPNGVIRDAATLKLFQDATKMKDTPLGDLLMRYYRFNLLSGIGTPMINLVGGAWMGPIFTALRHPFKGNFLAARAITKAIPFAAAEAKRTLQGKIGTDLLLGMTEQMPMNIGIDPEAHVVKRWTSEFLNRFGSKWMRAMYASDAFMRRLAFEGYTSVEYFKQLNEQYPNNPQKVAAEVAKYLLPDDIRNKAIERAKAELKEAGIEFNDSDALVRAYEILRTDELAPDLIEQGNTWADIVSLRGDITNVMPHIFEGAVNSIGRNFHPAVQAVAFPFVRALARLSDFGLDLVPGVGDLNRYLLTKAGKLPKHRTDYSLSQKVAQQRVAAGRNIGIGFAGIFLAMSLAGILEITGEEEDVIDKEGEEGEGKAQGRAEFEEYKQKGKEAFSIYLPGIPLGFKYKDIPGLNSILFGVHKFQKSIENGGNPIGATLQFYQNAFKNALPFFSDQTLSGPYKQLWKGISEAQEGAKVEKALWEAANSMSRGAIPASALLSDIKKVYDTTPESTIQDEGIKLLRNIPGVSWAIGSKAALDRFGMPEEKTLIEHVPGVSRVLAQQKVRDDEVWKALYNRGLVIPELPKAITFRKRDFVNDQARERYEASREERLSKAYTNTFTPDEWHQFVLATGPQVRRMAAELVRSSAPDAVVQKEIIKRTRKIEEESRKRYIRSGKF